jgi:hypothetical protein
MQILWDKIEQIIAPLSLVKPIGRGMRNNIRKHTFQVLSRVVVTKIERSIFSE